MQMSSENHLSRRHTLQAASALGVSAALGSGTAAAEDPTVAGKTPGAIAEKAVEALLRSGQIVSRDQMGSVVDAFNEQLIGQAYWTEVLHKHPDGLDIKDSDEFKDWISKQPKEMKVLAASVEPKDGIKLIDYYKEETGKARRKKTAAPPSREERGNPEHA